MTESQPKEPNASTDATTDSEAAPEPSAGGAAQRDLDLIHSRLEAMGLEISSLNRTLLILGVVAAIACLTAFAGLTKALAAREQAAQATRELHLLSAKLKKLPSARVPQPRRILPAATPAEPQRPTDADEKVLRELGRIQRLVGSAPAQQAEVEAGFVAWGQEIRQYVDRALAQADEGHRRERGEELRPVFQRLLEIEARLQAR